MKTLSLAFLITVSSVPGVQAQSMAVATYALKGPVRTVRTEVGKFLKDGDYVEGRRVLRMTIEFNEDGNRTELGMYDDQGVLVRRIQMKFEGRRMIEYLNYDGAGNVWLRGTDVYDKSGQLIEQATYNGDGSLRSKTVRKRNERGQVVEMTERSATGSLMEQINSKYDAAGALESYERSLYFPNGALQSTELHEIPQKRVLTVNYNSNGSVKSTSEYVDKKIDEYAADGSLTKTTMITDQGRLPDRLIYDKSIPARRESEIPDQLDSHGNWIKQTKWITDVDGIRPVQVTYRTITYYEK